MNLDWTIVVSTFVGGFLAAGTGYLFEVRREKTRLAYARRLLKTAICDDLAHALTLYDKIADEWEKTKTVWFATLNELRESRFTFQNNKDWVHVFEDPVLRRTIFRYYLQSADRINLEYQQRRRYEIEARLNETVRDIKLKDSTIAHDTALNMAIGYMEAESREYDNLRQAIPESVQKLAQFKTQAQELLQQLSRVK